ncbi:osteopetrosis-associated transmembrane protein 1 [Drosophila innubila]|uniref:osteopetrosis-associated transmembrane protein 1 n=1 Tax=Drosophila innubila TaxID=198719 RepID=UPI00148D32E8|nr:osteopetrosis-associated transmembrane protein 1 [Drosophila innubila]
MGKLLILFIFSCITHTVLSTSCKTLLHELANEQHNFVFCTTTHAIPDGDNRFCGSCEGEHNLMKTAFDLLMKNENCSKLYKDADRMNVVSTTQKLLDGLWDRAYCENCFQFDGQVLTNFTELHDGFRKCISLTNKKDLCINCKAAYIYMNDFYLNLDKKNNGHICYDIQDIMNRTRVLWSKELKCCQREVNMTIFLTCVGVVALLPLLLFYSGAVVLTKRREAHHGLLNEQEPELDAPSTSQLITAAILSTTPSEPPAVIQARTEIVPKLVTLTDDSSDLSSDDEPALKPKIN